MPNYQTLRRVILRELYARTGGNLMTCVWLNELARALSLEQADADAASLHLAQKGLVTYSRDTTGDGGLSMTIHGVEEAEKMTRPFLQRWPSEHPVLFGSLMAVLTGLIVGGIIKYLPAP
jgi:hypothetical protein